MTVRLRIGSKIRIALTRQMTVVKIMIATVMQALEMTITRLIGVIEILNKKIEAVTGGTNKNIKETRLIRSRLIMFPIMKTTGATTRHMTKTITGNAIILSGVNRKIEITPINGKRHSGRIINFGTRTGKAIANL